MKGLDLAEMFYERHGNAMIANQFVSYVDRIAVGFAGPGSECFGFDDEISRDHDWGPAFCLWLTSEDHESIGRELQNAYRNLPKRFMEFGPRITSPGEERRTGVSEIGAFYKTYTGLEHVPETLNEWFNVPEQGLATCTNGRVFTDPLGEFTRWRKALLDYFPEDIRLKKMASRCITAAQAGQYNLERSLKRNDLFAARYSEIKFCEEIISLIYLLNKKYRPFYKWIFRGLKDLPILGERVYKMISDLVGEEDLWKKPDIIENICVETIRELRSEGLSDSNSGFLLDHAGSIQERISEPLLRGRLSVVK
ncbi:MAG: DUF4037 domain-containing protein [Deltaproteobacteria bacterium]|nr:DUF4037 domain-containing protein [Deltaproteobacteria bacterium]